MVLLIVLSLCFGDLLNSEGSVIAKTLRLVTNGDMAFSVRTATYNGAYAPRNAGVIWITNSQNQFVKTIKVWASNYRYTLIRWINSSSQNTTGAITGASKNTHQLHSITWNGKDYQGNDMPDGDYKVNIEFTEHNATANNLGKFKQVTFTKGSEPVNLTIPNETYFRDMSLTWTPVIVNGTLSGTVTGIGGIPLADAVITAGSNSVFSSGNGSYNLSLSPGTWDVSCVVDGYTAQIIPGVVVTAAQNTPLNFSMDPVSNDDPTVPSSPLQLSLPSPNPFQSYCKLNYTAKIPSTITATVFNLKGQKVRSLDTTNRGSITWDGTNESGKQCVNGVYYVKVRSGNQSATRRIILQR